MNFYKPCYRLFKTSIPFNSNKRPVLVQWKNIFQVKSIPESASNLKSPGSKNNCWTSFMNGTLFWTDQSIHIWPLPVKWFSFTTFWRESRCPLLATFETSVTGFQHPETSCKFRDSTPPAVVDLQDKNKWHTKIQICASEASLTKHWARFSKFTRRETLCLPLPKYLFSHSENLQFFLFSSFTTWSTIPADGLHDVAGCSTAQNKCPLAPKSILSGSSSRNSFKALENQLIVI